MTRKDYILIAGALRNTRIALELGNENGGKTLPSELRGLMFGTESIANVLASDNPRFDRNHFLAVVRGEKELNSRPTRKVGA